MNSPIPRPALALAVLLATLAGTLPGVSQTREQTLDLHAGWNAVFLEVEPADVDPGAVFTNTPIDIVARYFPRTSPVQYIMDPAGASWNEPGWGVWYAPSRPESAISSLHAIHGSKPYLVHTPSSCRLSLIGSVAFLRQAWQADSFNLVGFGVDEQSPPSFERYFAASGGRVGQRIYRLDGNGKWQPVTLPAATIIRAGEAYWVFCTGKTDYQGPMEVKVPGLTGLDFGNSGSRLDIEFFNTSLEPAVVTVEAVSGSGDLPLSKLVRDTATLQTSYAELSSISQVGVTAGQVETLALQVRREAMAAVTQTRLLKLTTSQGLRYWVPVRAQRSDLAAQP